jgi:type IV pilus biogenesis protein CpaD/CtpE
MTVVRFASILAAAVAILATGGCFQPPRTMPDASVIGYNGRNVVPPDCDQLTRSSLLTDAGWRRPSMQWGCATYSNLAAQVANPKDLVAPGPLGPADAAVAASAVRRYETGRVMSLDPSTTRGSH